MVEVLNCHPASLRQSAMQKPRSNRLCIRKKAIIAADCSTIGIVLAQSRWIDAIKITPDPIAMNGFSFVFAQGWIKPHQGGELPQWLRLAAQLAIGGGFINVSGGLGGATCQGKRVGIGGGGYQHGLV